MANFFKKIISGISGPKEEESVEASERLQEYEQIFKLAKTKHLSDEKKAELENLYVQLIKKSDNATSGQLQFLGLDQIKQKMGDKWLRLQPKVYATAEKVINSHITSRDIHFLYKEDRYVIIFTQSTDEEINRKIAIISEEILQRLAELDEEELQTLQIKQEIKKIDAETFLQSEFPDMLDFVFKQYNPGYSTEASTDVPSAQLVQKTMVSLQYRYFPLWNIDKKAFTTHLCVAHETGNNQPIFEAYKALFQKKTLAERTAIDIAVLEKVIEELEDMEINERRGMLMCPVQHETLYNFGSYDEFKNICQTIPNSQRDNVIFMVTDSENFSLPSKDPYWFIPLMKDYCRGIVIDIPMREAMAFYYLKNTGAIGLSVQVTPVFPSEEKNLDILIGFSAQAKHLKMKKSFALNIPTASAAKTLAGMGFSLLGGPGIMPHVAAPEETIDPVQQLNLLNLTR